MLYFNFACTRCVEYILFLNQSKESKHTYWIFIGIYGAINVLKCQSNFWYFCKTHNKFMTYLM